MYTKQVDAHYLVTLPFVCTTYRTPTRYDLRLKGIDGIALHNVDIADRNVAVIGEKNEGKSFTKTQ